MSAAQSLTTVVVNGKDAVVPPEATVTTFLAERGFHDKLVVVELNGVILPRDQFATTTLADGDRLEVVHFVGGGSPK